MLKRKAFWLLVLAASGVTWIGISCIPTITPINLLGNFRLV